MHFVRRRRCRCRRCESSKMAATACSTCTACCREGSAPSSTGSTSRCAFATSSRSSAAYEPAARRSPRPSGSWPMTCPSCAGTSGMRALRRLRRSCGASSRSAGSSSPRPRVSKAGSNIWTGASASSSTTSTTTRHAPRLRHAAPCRQADLDRDGGIGGQPGGQRANVQTPADAVVASRCAPAGAGALRSDQPGPRAAASSVVPRAS